MYMAFNEQGKRCQAALLAAHKEVEERTTKNMERLARKEARRPIGRPSQPKSAVADEPRTEAGHSGAQLDVKLCSRLSANAGFHRLSFGALTAGNRAI